MEPLDLFCDCRSGGHPGEPCTVVIVGASGDLAARKLVPALANLFAHGSLPSPVTVVGAGRTEMDDSAFREHLRAFADAEGIALARWEEFAPHLFYRTLRYDAPESFAALAASLRELDARRGTGGNFLFHLAIPPGLYGPVAESLGRAGLSAQGREGLGWTRIVVEKPFGRDLASAVELDQTLRQSFAEEQIFRIDHYLAKDTVQNILMFRFANAIFEPIWNRGYIDSVGIVAAESLGVGHRAGYYEEAGVLRDMFQNHMMQLLSLIAMEPPARFEADLVHDEKVKVFRAVKPFAAERLEEDLVLGQYGPGRMGGKALPGYLDEPGVAPGSCTPTFAMLRLFIDNWRWRGVPFHLVSGKRLGGKVTRVVVQFREVPHSMFAGILSGSVAANRLEIGIHPEERISLRFEAKRPGPVLCLSPVDMDFRYEREEGPVFDAYEKVLLDCIAGDHMLFWRQDGVEASWSCLSPILEACEMCPGRARLLRPYPAGTWGPERALEWMRHLLPGEMSGG